MFSEMFRESREDSESEAEETELPVKESNDKSRLLEMEWGWLWSLDCEIMLIQINLLFSISDVTCTCFNSRSYRVLHEKEACHQTWKVFKAIGVSRCGNLLKVGDLVWLEDINLFQKNVLQWLLKV